MKLYKKQLLAYLSAFWCVLYIHYIRYTPFIAKENIVFGLFSLSLYLVLFGIQKRKSLTYVLFTVLYSYLLHVDERYLFYLPFILAYVVLVKREVVKGILVSVGFILLLLPWTIRNYHVYDRIMILTERTAVITDKIFGYEKLSVSKRHNEPNFYILDDISLYENLVDSAVKGLDVNGRHVKGGEKVLEGIRNGNVPITYSKNRKRLEDFSELLRPFRFKSGYIAYGYRYKPAWRPISNILYGLQYGILLLSFALLSVQIVLSESKELKFLLLIVVLNIIIHVFVAHAIQRYRVPIDFIIILIGTSGLWIALEKLNSKVRSNRSNLNQ